MSNIKYRKKTPKLFTNDLKSLLYAYGDVTTPNLDTAFALEDILVEYLVDVCHEAQIAAKLQRRNKVKVEDFKFAIRKDPAKLGRVNELLVMQRDINEARKAFDDSEGKKIKKDEKEPKEKKEKKKKKDERRDD
ncbi:unnamed protein product [Kuraishia capsulata CBS 1993]|uniref:Transcription initiation factor TFIID subunit 13 n=1 Tax=Kuraishia capsulata CBS 1993 TaxID=1382522 RepID=W6MU78_9ASCO|nr:uncharacterized protein KUCA_T00004928001 [Kuraishia capsulata CBS 1993]CDK28942.1 unnamed protein product [Kuraishia capsulata CBS 1993]